MRTLAVLLIAAAHLAIASRSWAEDIVVLQDGRKITGTIFREDEIAVFLKVEGGEERGIPKVRIAEIQRDAKVGKSAPLAGAPKPLAQVPKDGNAPLLPDPDIEKKDNQEIMEKLADLGDSSRDKRKAALERAKELGFRAMPVLLSMFNPRRPQSADLRIGALRALAELGPLDQQGAETIGYTAMKDLDPEVRREAARAIRTLKDDRSVNYVLQFAAREDKQVQFQAARALREINDDRAFAMLAQVIPQVSVQGSAPPTREPGREVMLPVGPMGSLAPVTLPEGSVSGVVANVNSPAADALRVISGKDLGGMQMVWLNWINEKIGATTQYEREQMVKKKSLGSKLGQPVAPRP